MFFRVVKLASPNINYLLIAGAALMYTCVFLYTFMFTEIDEVSKQTVLCNVRKRCVMHRIMHEPAFLHTHHIHTYVHIMLLLFLCDCRFVSGCFHWDTHFVLV